MVYIIDGNYAGSYGILKGVKGNIKDEIITVKMEKDEIETLGRYAFVVNKDIFKR